MSAASGRVGAGIDGEYEFGNFLGCWQCSLHWDGYGLCICICQNSTSVHLRLVHFIGYKLYVWKEIPSPSWWSSYWSIEGNARGASGEEPPPDNAEDVRDARSIPSSGRSPEGGHGHPLQDPCLENPTDRGAWRATVHRVTKSQTRLKRLSTHTHINACSWNLSKNTTWIDRVTKSWTQLGNWACLSTTDGCVVNKRSKMLEVGSRRLMCFL